MALYDDKHERTVTITLNDLGNTDLRRIYQILDDLEDTDQATEIWLHIAETAEARAQSSRNCGDPETAAWFEEKAAEYAEVFEEDPEEDNEEVLDMLGEALEDEQEEAEDTDEYLDKLVKVWREYPPNHNIDAALKANAADTNADPNNLFRAGVFEGLAEAAAWGSYEWSQTDDINAIKAAIYRAYNVAW